MCDAASNFHHLGGTWWDRRWNQVVRFFPHTINIIKPAPAGWKIGNKAGDSSANGAPKPWSADGLMGCHNEAHYSPLP